MTKRIYHAIFGVSLVSLVTVCVILTVALTDYFAQLQRRQLRAEVELVARGVSKGGADYFSGLDLRDVRVTLIAKDGKVLFDNRSSAEAMENHQAREEVRLARTDGFGEATRFSTTRMERLFYAAIRLPDGSVLRLAHAQRSGVLLVMGFLPELALAVGVALLLALFFAGRIAHRLVDPLNRLNLDEPLDNDVYPEMVPILRRLDAQQKDLAVRNAELRRKEEEFDAVTSNLREGLIVYTADGCARALNHAARHLFGLPPEATGTCSLLDLNRTPAFQTLIHKALRGEASETTLDLVGGHFRAATSPIVRGGIVCGGAIVFFDESARIQAERIRREFTANVSHELKTPIQAISGAGELLMNGLVKPEDLPVFYARIYADAERMGRLVTDILNLSRLDEGHAGGVLPVSDVCLGDMARRVLDAMQPAADAAGVTLSLTGDLKESITGVPQLLEEIVHNLCDNAVRYNKHGGRVDVRIVKTDGSVALTVADTGIGIPMESQDRVFERFYRVDKSRSRALGGTGLGLSIVKHAAEWHKAEILLKSCPGEGTSITVTFPKP